MTIREEFEQWWESYPRRVAKFAAFKAYQKARIVATAEELTAGVQTYLQHLPDEPRFVAHASSWLTAGRWTDDYTETPAVQKPKAGPYKVYVPLKDRSA